MRYMIRRLKHGLLQSGLVFSLVMHLKRQGTAKLEVLARDR